MQAVQCPTPALVCTLKVNARERNILQEISTNAD